ncbi:Glutamate receptor ionotropic, NMDA 1 [Cichlidogyrus casuarinus]|uniref:Glutamate receptor ionotropic, NMDA 1 n=1 Tax=Cichlidogyrus casuarinus TaxID=1844966 RepID=A0ABD2PP61_9PLAT
MLLFEGEPVVFSLFSLATFCLLIGGCLWGSMEDKQNQAGRIVGIFIFSVGVFATVLFFALFIYKKRRKNLKMKRQREEIEKFKRDLDAPVNHLQANGIDNNALELDTQPIRLQNPKF